MGQQAGIYGFRMAQLLSGLLAVVFVLTGWQTKAGSIVMEPW